MRLLQKTLYTVGFLLILGCSEYGAKLQYQKTEIYYTNLIEKEEAEKLGDFLVSSKFAGENEKSVQLSKNEENNHYEFRMVTTKKAAKSETYEAIFKIYAKQLSDSVFNSSPVDFHVCDNTFKTLKIIPFN